VVTGRLRERFWSSNDRSGRSLEIEAYTLGHDLVYGTTEFVRIVRAERVDKVRDLEGDRMAYCLAQDAAGEADDRAPTDISGLTMLDGLDRTDRDSEPDHDPDEVDEVDEVITLLPDSAVA
jgi:single-strand DNA-binding protein